MDEKRIRKHLLAVILNKSDNPDDFVLALMYTPFTPFTPHVSRLLS